MLLMLIRFIKSIEMPELGRFDQVVLFVWLVGIVAAVWGYILASVFRNLIVLDGVFWRTLWFVGFSFGTFVHVGMAFYGGQLTKTVKGRYNRYFDMLYEQDVRGIGQFIELTSDSDLVQLFQKFKFYRYLTITTGLLFVCNVLIGRYVMPSILR